MIRDVHKIAVLVLAAGYSSRMGAFKPLLPLGETTVIEKAVGSFLVLENCTAKESINKNM